MRQITGTLPKIVRNYRGIYEGDLRSYYKKIFRHARNLNNPYHNWRHMMHVLCLCHEALEHYKDEGMVFQKRDARNLLIAAAWHDFDHTGRTYHDEVNIRLAVRGFRDHIEPEDRPYETQIIRFIHATQWPHDNGAEYNDLFCQIIRDADQCQCFDSAWLQQVVFGLAAEWGVTPMKVLEGQPDFLRNVIRLHSSWGKERFGSFVEAKIVEVRDHIELLS